MATGSSPTQTPSGDLEGHASNLIRWFDVADCVHLAVTVRCVGFTE
jgi:hypothetical protein